MAREWRCCMCSVEYLLENCKYKPEMKCDFYVVWADQRGWMYKVMPALGDNRYRGRYQKPGTTSWKSMKQMEMRSSFEEAQHDLNVYAKSKGWVEVQK